MIQGRDVTTRKRLEQSLERSQRLESVALLAGGVAHDFNNLLTVINGQTEMLLLGELDPEIRESLADVLEAGTRASALTAQLLAYGRRTVLRVRTIDLREVVSNAASILRRVATERVHVALELGTGDAWVHADPAQIERVLLNLVINARDAMPDGGRLTIRVRPDTSDDGMMALEVEDTGVGMDAETLERIFDPFFTTKPAQRGTGLGLASVHSIVTQMGGHVSVASAPGAGTRFVVQLPRTAEAGAPIGANAPTPVVPHTRRRVLVVDDDVAVRRFARRVLERAGHVVTEACSAAEARALASADAALDVVLTDVVMPGGSGHDVARAFAAASPPVPTIFMSGHAHDVELLRSLVERGALFLEKPFSSSALLEVVASIS